jgi:ribose transport system permease protein
MSGPPDAAVRPAPIEPPRGRGPRRERLIRIGFQTLGIGTFYLFILIFFSIASPYFLTYSNALNILTNVSVIGIVAIGQALAVISGGFDLSVSGTLPLGAVVFALLSNAGFGVAEAMLLAIAVGAFVGLINGVIVTKLQINPLITTLGTLSIGVGLAFTLSSGVTIPFADLDAGVLADKTFGGLSYYLVAFLLLSILAFSVLRFTVFGRMLYAIGGNREASRLAGMRIDLVTIAVYVQCGSLAAFAGVVVASQLLAGSATVGTDAALSSIAAVILGGASLTGGVGGIPGTLIGVLVLGTIANVMVLLQVPAFYQQIATGAILLVGVGFARLRGFLSGEQS